MRGHFTSAVNRRLALHRVLPSRYERYVSIDADMLVTRPGLARLADLDLRGLPLAAAMDMIFLKDFEDGPLTAEFRTYRARLGLTLDTPYFNNGLTLVDRHEWERLDVPGAATTFLAANSDRCPFLEQSALNAVIQGQFAPLSPRYNFMGDFLLLDLETRSIPSSITSSTGRSPGSRAGAATDRFADPISRMRSCTIALARTGARRAAQPGRPAPRSRRTPTC